MLTNQGRLARRKPILIAAAVIGAAAIAAGYFGFVDRRIVTADTDGAVFAPGFVGASRFGDWEMLCTQAAEPAIAPESFDSPDTGANAAPAESTCRVRYEAVAQQTGDAGAQKSETPADAEAEPRVILSVSLSRVGAGRSPALMLRLPATLSEGDPVIVRTRDEFALEVLARDCSADECIAAASLSEAEWERLVEANGFEIIFPLDETQRVSVVVSGNGLRDALAALDATHKPVQ
jgi:invasion protein IalB